VTQFKHENFDYVERDCEEFAGARFFQKRVTSKMSAGHPGKLAGRRTPPIDCIPSMAGGIFHGLIL